MQTRNLFGRLILALSLLVGLAVAAPLGSAAADETDGRIELEARLEPADLAPGMSGTLVVKGTLFDKLHIYATSDEGYPGVEWRVLESDGVTYDVEGASMTAAHDFTEPDFGDVYKVYEGEIEWKIPVTLAADLKDGTRVGISVDYSGCDDDECFTRVTEHAAAVWFTGTSDAGASWAVTDPAPATDVVAKPPEASKPVAGKQGIESVAIALSEDGAAVVVTVTPAFGNHVYGPLTEDGAGIKVSVDPVAAEGVEWGTAEFPDVGESHDPIVVTVPFTRTTATSIAVKVGWQACDDFTHSCYTADEATLSVAWDGPAVTTTTQEAPQGDIRFDVVLDDKLAIQGDNLILDFYDDYGLLVIALIFGLGVLLAFTPCVLPIIPITISVITGGRADIPRRRLLGLLTVYVSSLALTFGSVGIITALAGSSMSAAFQEPKVIIGISVLFGLLAFGMLGIFELQPPQWLLKVQGGAQQKGGSFFGAVLLGSLMALVASPCTGPFIVGMGLVSAKTQSVGLGFAMFTSMGLGMGAVLFAFGALNFALRPGPWMVWVRYSFGMLLLGGALYQVAFPGILPMMWVWIVGIGFALLAGALVIWHLKVKEGEGSSKVLLVRGGGVAAMLAFATILVAILAQPPAPPPNVDPSLVKFETLRDVEHLMARVEQSRAEGKPVVVDVWATTCFYCKKYEALILESAELRHGFSRMTRLKIDTSEGDQSELRDALGIPRGTQPYFVFLDGEGRIRRAADIDRWHGDKSTAAFRERLRLVLGDEADVPDETAAAN